MDVNEYNKLLHYKKFSMTSSKLLTRAERHFRTKLRLFTIRDGKLYRDGRRVLHSEDALATLIMEHRDRNHPNRLQLESFTRTKYHVERLRQFCRKVVASCRKCQQRVGVRKTGPMVHLDKRRVERLCKQLGIPSNGTHPLSPAFKKRVL